jgi:cation diffusion facilitator CzcD-associated flavoprotein CzcO
VSAEPVVIVGAGPYGLSLAAHLRPLGVPFRIFGEPMRSWRLDMPPGMYLKSEGCASSISAPGPGHELPDFCAERGIEYADYWRPVALETFVAYGLWFQERLVPEVEPRAVILVRPCRRGFDVALDDGETIRASRVVVASGAREWAHIPPPLRDLEPRLVSHSSAYGDLAPLAGRDVTVIGGGQSALETAALAQEAGARARVLVRRPRLEWNAGPGELPSTRRSRLRMPPSPLGAGWRLWLAANWAPTFRRLPPQTRVRLVRTTLGPAGAWWLRERVEGRLPVVLGARVGAAEAADGAVRLRIEGPDRRPADLVTEHVIAATGYRPDLGRLPFLERSTLARLRRVGGAPWLSGRFESTVPGLHFVGLAAAHSFGPVCRFVTGTAATSPRLARHLARAG